MRPDKGGRDEFEDDVGNVDGGGGGKMQKEEATSGQSMNNWT